MHIFDQRNMCYMVSQLGMLKILAVLGYCCRELKFVLNQNFYVKSGFKVSQMGKRGNCSICNGEIIFLYKPMEQWRISGNLCGVCYGRKLNEYYILSRGARENNP